MQYSFEDFVIDSDRRELTRNAEPIAVGPQVFDLLLHLVRNREHVVSKDELLDAVWAGRIVSESTVTSHINAARKAIGDSGQNQRLLRTIARKGFRFVGDVSEIASRSAAVSTEPDAPDKTIVEAPALPDRPSIAALPFVNLSGDIEQEYFTDGVVEDIITALSRIRWLFVVARNSSFTYKGRAVDVKQVGRELGVRYVLEGSVRKAAHKVRITGQLIDATTGAHLRAEIERAKRKPTESLDAYDYYLRGMAHLHLGSRESIDLALGQFNHALMRDPNFASAYAMAAWCYFWRKVNGWMTDRPGEIAEGARLARRAVDLGRDDAVALTRGGHALAHLTEDVAGGIAVLDRALVLNPNLASAWFLAGFLRTWNGEPDAAIEYFAHAMRLSPLDPELYRMQAGLAAAHLFAGRFEAASSWAEKAFRELPSFLMVVSVIAASHALAGRPDEVATFADGLRKAGLPE